MRTLLRVLPVCLLIGCGGPNYARPEVPPCADPVVLPDRALSNRDIEVMWGRDRSALRECVERLGAITG
jgi:hypothetical protein